MLDHFVAELLDPLLEGRAVLVALLLVADQEDVLQDGCSELQREIRARHDLTCFSRPSFSES